MSDGTVLTSGATEKPDEATSPGIPGGKASDLKSFQGASGTSGDPAGKSPASGGKKGKGKGKIGRPPTNAAGFSKATIDEVADDPEIEAARVEFEEAIVELLVATTDGLADKNFLVLKTKYPEAEARGLADKFRLTDKEKTYFGKVAIRLWRKYLGDQYLFTDESIAGIFLLKYCLRNFEGFNQSRKIEAELNVKSNDKRLGLQGAASAYPRGEQNGKVDANGASDRYPSSPLSPSV